jgi:putative transposase
MSASRPGVLSPGDRVRFVGVEHQVVALSGVSVRLVDDTGAASVVLLAQMLCDASFAVLSAAGRRVALPPDGALVGLDAAAVARARWWERHLVEVLTGVPPDAEPGTGPRPGFDPATCSLRERELRKVAELRAAGEAVGHSTLKRMRARFETQGLIGLVDRRQTRASSVAGRTDARVVAAMRRAVEEETQRSTGTVGRLRIRTEAILDAEYGPGSVQMPSQATFYRLAARVSAGRHTFGSARTRRSLAQRPEAPFSTLTVLRPGEVMQIDSTPLDIAVVLDDGVVGRVELSAVVDIATRWTPRSCWPAP